MHNIHTNFIKIIDVLKDIIGNEINEKGNYLRRGSVPKFSPTIRRVKRSALRIFNKDEYELIKPLATNPIAISILRSCLCLQL